MAVDVSDLDPLQQLRLALMLPDPIPNETVERLFLAIEDRSQIEEGRQLLRRHNVVVSRKVEAGLRLSKLPKNR